MTKTERKVMEAFWNSHQQDRAYWHRDGVAAALRETINQLQYDNADWDAPDEHMIIDVKDILKLIEELEALK